MFPAVSRSVRQSIPSSPILRSFSSSTTKRTPSSYILFSMEKRPEVKAANPQASFGDLNRQLGQMWRSLGEAEKSVYTKKAEELKAAAK